MTWLSVLARLESKMVVNSISCDGERIPYKMPGRVCCMYFSSWISDAFATSWSTNIFRSGWNVCELAALVIWSSKRPNPLYKRARGGMFRSGCGKSSNIFCSESSCNLTRCWDCWVWPRPAWPAVPLCNIWIVSPQFLEMYLSKRKWVIRTRDTLENKRTHQELRPATPPFYQAQDLQFLHR